MKTMQTLQEIFQSDPTIEAAIIQGMDWETTPDAQADNSKWAKFADVGLFNDANLPPFKKASDVPRGVKYPIRAMKKMNLKHGASVSISQVYEMQCFNIIFRNRFSFKPMSSPCSCRTASRIWRSLNQLRDAFSPSLDSKSAKTLKKHQ